MKQATKKGSPKSPCEKCNDIEKFSFKGCAKSCEKIFKHLKVVFAQKGSPCRDFRCGMPGVDKNNRGKCRECPLPGIYDRNLGDGVLKSVMGKPFVPFVTEWDIKHDRSHRR